MREATLLLIGGAEDRSGECLILKEFMALAGGSTARIVVLAAATRKKEADSYKHLFSQLGAQDVAFLALNTRTQAQDEAAAATILSASGIFFTGGDQLRITAIIGGTKLEAALFKAAAAGAVIAGTSAGASVMSGVMIVGGQSDASPSKGLLHLAPGIGLLTGAVVDQHFAQRGRLGRLLAAVAANPRVLGIGIDEDTAVKVHGNSRLEVIGSHTVSIVDGQAMTYTNISEQKPDQPLALFNANLHILASGCSFNLDERRPAHA